MRRPKPKFETRDIVKNGRTVKRLRVQTCHICGGHKKITPGPADGECLGHEGLFDYLQPF